jgi:preprotein translocase subunit SecF
MMFGVVLVGTYTSIFIAAPILIYLGVGTHRAEAPETPSKPEKLEKTSKPEKTSKK